MTREEAIEVLKNTEGNINYDTKREEIYFTHKWVGAYEMAIAALREQPQWISVEERLPQETGEVCRVVNLMMDNGLETAGWLNDITGLGYFLDSRSSFIRQAPISRFTHWTPLPEPPKEEV